MEQPRLDRMLRLMMLLTANTTYTVDQLADRLNTTPRTIYRYIDTFRVAGFVIKKTGGTIFRIDKASPYFKDISSLIHFTDEEAWLLKSAIESIDETNLIKQNLKKKLYTVYNYKILADTVVKGKYSQIVDCLSEAMQFKQQVILRNYCSANSNIMRDRRVEPFKFTTNFVQIWAFDTESETCKLFKLARTQQVENCPEPWQFASRHQAGYLDIFRIHSNRQIQLRLRLGMRAANLLMEEYPLAEKEMKRESDNRWLLTTTVCSWEGPARFVAGLLDDIEIIEPDEFKLFMAEKLSRGLSSLTAPPTAIP